jgi:hypothetical protein
MSTMTTRPILFSGPMVRGLLEDRKTQTRRIVKPQPARHESWDWSWPVLRPGVTPGTRICWRDDIRQPNLFPYCPYGVPGDLLWVRESGLEHRAVHLFTHDATPGTWWTDDHGGRYGATYSAAITRDSLLRTHRVRPSIHMPRWASRLTLEITDVRVERLQDISPEDADAECFGGMFPGQVLPELFPGPRDQWAHLSIPQCYGRLWESINGPGSWDANPWVWAVSFKVHAANVDTFDRNQKAAASRAQG